MQMQRSWKLNDSAKNKARRTVAWLVALCVLLAASSAFAKKRVVVLSFTGPQGGKAAAAVASAVKKRHTVVSSAQYTKAEKRLKAKKVNDKNVAKVAAEIQVDAVITGVMKKKGGKFTLTVSVREGASGRVKGSAKIALRGAKIDQRAKDDIEAEVVPLVDDVQSISGGGGGGSDDFASNDSSVDDKKPPKKGKKPPEDDTSSADTSADASSGSGSGSSDDTGEQEAVPGVDDNKQVASSGDGETSADSSVSKSADDGAPTEIVGGKYARNAGFSIDGGVSVVARTLSFTTRSGLARNQQPSGYDGTVVPGGMVDGEIYPLVLMGSKPDSLLAGLGVTFLYDRVFLLKSKAGSEEYTTTQQRYGVGLRFRLNIGHKPTLPTVFVGIGYNSLSFAIDADPTVTGLPDVNYSYVDPNIGFRMPLGTDKLALLAEARYLLILGSGAFSEQDNYGSGTTVGVDFEGGLEYRLMPRLPIHVGIHYVRIAYDFDGTGKLANNLDGDSTSADVGGALDEYLGGYATIGYIF
jgi:hypothetical protein